ncbi:hypothetical protein N7489_000090 [Penicillium chrysogenum]|uniref:F-box domain-containing protein n=1 Tax=Penicillium chrysogenum TaxID=5076 RepID=A0ABQ8WFE0_PENCH|nr:uncharacterized protein N7489_000090 [Penicillium chrysogenum]KAJ5249680.1 hypothetical protein N7489_000090 [Penicillium chrysogenum]KAJ5268585.1 hypothetical protein N7505_004343 [Penicillium chrysogenum]KAJ6148708.1 hypothetical protein N7497_010690 [Penicillium chrysogenum]
MAKPTLEGLPTELLILILLEIPDLASLKSIVLSSPIFHQAYLPVRQEALCGIVKNQWGVLLADAIAATRSRGLLFSTHKHEAIALLDTWRRKEEIRDLSLGSSIPIDEPNSLEEILHVLYLHKVFRFFLCDFAKNFPRPPWMESDEWETSVIPIELSQTEKHRILRALCRLQTYQNIFGSPESRDEEVCKNNYWTDNVKPSEPCHKEAYRVFFVPMPPWEFHEIGCVWKYFTTKFDPIYKEMTASLRDLVEKHISKDDYPCFELLPEDVRPPAGGLETFHSLQNLPYQSESLASMGPDFVYRLLHGTPLMQRDMVILNSRDGALGCFPLWGLMEEDKLPFLYPADRHAVRDYEQFWSTLPSVEQPNLGWKKLYLLREPDTQGTLEDVVDLEHPDVNTWRPGLTIFDDERLTAWKAPLSEYRPY